MSRTIDQEYLIHNQYRSAAKLDARLAIHARFGTNPYGWHRWVFDRFILPQDADILEVGCGPGTLWLENSERIPASWTITLTDLSDGILDDARRRLANINRPIEFHTVDVQQLPFLSNRFDAVVANHMLYHVPDRQAAFTEIRRVMKPGGLLFAATNGKNHMAEIRALHAGPDTLSHDGFSLENGQAQLMQYFRTVSDYQYEDSLMVTDAKSVAGYIASSLLSRNSTVTALNRITETVQREIDLNGAFHVTKSAGLLVAVKG